jgi:hypothetical protein
MIDRDAQHRARDSTAERCRRVLLSTRPITTSASLPVTLRIIALASSLTALTIIVERLDRRADVANCIDAMTMIAISVTSA